MKPSCVGNPDPSTNQNPAFQQARKVLKFWHEI
jgi:hypothetical protein